MCDRYWTIYTKTSNSLDLSGTWKQFYETEIAYTIHVTISIIIYRLTNFYYFKYNSRNRRKINNYKYNKISNKKRRSTYFYEFLFLFSISIFGSAMVIFLCIFSIGIHLSYIKKMKHFISLQLLNLFNF